MTYEHEPQPFDIVTLKSIFSSNLDFEILMENTIFEQAKIIGAGLSILKIAGGKLV